MLRLTSATGSVEHRLENQTHAARSGEVWALFAIL